MSGDYSVGDLVAEFLTACGVTTAFGIASVHNIPMLDAIGRRNTIRFVMARGALGGAHMAHGSARFSGSPVLHITGMTMTKFADRDLGSVHDPIDQLGMMRSVCKAAYRVRSAQQALGILTRAATEALTAPT